MVFMAKSKCVAAYVAKKGPDILEASKSESSAAMEPPPFSAKLWLEELEKQLKDPDKVMVKFGGSTGDLQPKAVAEESFIMTWNNPKREAIFEMPMGGAAIMNSGANMVQLARKEHSMALGTQLRSKFKINDYRIFRRLPNNEIQLIHPADGVFPEKVNAGRTVANQVQGSIINPKS